MYFNILIIHNFSYTTCKLPEDGVLTPSGEPWGGFGGVQPPTPPPPPEIPKALQNRAKLDPIVKNVKNC